MAGRVPWTCRSRQGLAHGRPSSLDLPSRMVPERAERVEGLFVEPTDSRTTPAKACTQLQSERSVSLESPVRR